MKTIVMNWHAMRWLRLVVALWLGYVAYTEHQPIAAWMGGVFALQAIFNTGCYSVSGCTTVTKRRKSADSRAVEITYDEVQ